jgi:FkbM family methyltransferase
MKLNFTQKALAAISTVGHRRELKGVLLRRYWNNHKTFTTKVAGRLILFDTSDFLSNILLFQNEYSNGYEPAVSELIAKLIPNSKVYADVGANIGYFSVLPAVLNPSCKIFYFEMDVSIRRLLLKNIALNHIAPDQITIVNAAIGDKEIEVEYTPHPFSFLAIVANESTDSYDIKLKSQTISLDNYFLQQGVTPDLIKIDIDGAEMAALRGMARILESRPTLLLEVHPTILPGFGSSSSEVFGFLDGRGYKFYLISEFRHASNAGLKPISNFDGLSSKSGDMVLVTIRQGVADLLRLI